VKRRLWRFGTRILGVALIGLVIWLVGWEDRVLGADGEERRGRIVRASDTEAVLRTDDGEVTIELESPDDVKRGLAGAFSNLAHAPGFALLAAVCLLASVCLAQLRWHTLLEGADLATPFPTVLRFGWIGLFFNQVLPAGQVGGDLVKGYYIARKHAGRKTMAVVSVLADRGLGVFVIFVSAAAAVGFAPSGTRLDLARNIVMGFVAVVGFFMVLLMLPGLRRRFAVSRFLERLPLGRVWAETARSFDVYGHRPRAVGLATCVSFLVHATFLACYACLGYAIGSPLGVFALLVAVPVATAAGALPGLPAGWGIGDMAFWFFLPAAGVPAGNAVALSFTFRALFMLLSLPGGLLLKEPYREIEKAMET